MIWKLGNPVCLGRWVGVLWWLGSLSLSVNLDHLSLSAFVGGHTVILELVVTRSSTWWGFDKMRVGSISKVGFVFSWIAVATWAFLRQSKTSRGPPTWVPKCLADVGPTAGDHSTDFRPYLSLAIIVHLNKLHYLPVSDQNEFEEIKWDEKISTGWVGVRVGWWSRDRNGAKPGWHYCLRLLG